MGKRKKTRVSREQEDVEMEKEEDVQHQKDGNQSSPTEKSLYEVLLNLLDFCVVGFLLEFALCLIVVMV